MINTTVFVLSRNEPTLKDCIYALEKNKYFDQVQVEFIKNISPVNEALNTILDRVDTPYYVQVDADMVLYPFALGRLITDIISAPKDVWMIDYTLYDTLFHRNVSGIKIFRSELSKQAQYENVIGCDVDHNEKMISLGFKMIQHCGFEHDVLGKHVISSPQIAYKACYDRANRYRMREIEDKRNYMKWIFDYFQLFIDWYTETEDLRYLWGWMGLNHGILSPGQKPDTNLLEVFYG